MHLFHSLQRHLIPLILAILVAAITFLLFIDVSRSSGKVIPKERITPYILCTEGQTIIRNKEQSTTLQIQEKKDIFEDDRIRTLANSSATVFWADGSVTRLGEKTNISIYELRTEASGATKVDFSLTEGKTWTNIARYLDPDSHFKERFDNDLKVAAVRGTTFDINLDKSYIHTDAHAIVIQDEKGEYITTLGAGSAVNTDRTNEKISPASLDTKWQEINVQADNILKDQRLTELRALVAKYQEPKTWLEELQTKLRTWFGIDTNELPVIIDTSGSGVLVTIDREKLRAGDIGSVLALYEKISGLQSTAEKLQSSSNLRAAAESLLSEREKKKYVEMFARASIYERWDSIEGNLPTLTEKLQTELQQYIESGRVDSGELEKIQKSLSMERVKMFNSKLEEWKKQGLGLLNQDDLLIQIFRADEEGIKNSIENFKDTIKSLGNTN